MKFSKEFLQEGVWDTTDTVVKEMVGKRRWVIEYRRVFRNDGKFYETRYDGPATELQEDSRPYEYDGDEIECPEVFAVEKTIIVYEKAKP